MDMNSIMEERVKPENIIPVLIPRKNLETFLEDVPHVPFENLEIVFKVSLGAGVMTTITSSYLEQLGMDENDLLDMALNNGIFKNEIEVMSMSQVLTELSSDSNEVEPLGMDSSNPDVKTCDMLIITNKSKFQGAAAILDKKTMAAIGNHFEDDLFVIPSSIHECICVAQSSIALDHIRDVVHGINREFVRPEEVLSDEVYHYDRAEKKISMAEHSLDRQPMPALQNQGRSK